MSVNISRPSLSGYGASAVSMSFDTNTLVISNAHASSKTGTFSTFTYTPQNNAGTGNVWSSAITVNGTSNSEFGQSASINYDGTRIAVGAPNIGKVYIYDWTGSGWSNYSNIIQCPVTTSSNNFGFSVSISPDLGDRVAIGAPGINTAYVYELKSNNQWTQTWKHQETTLKSLIKCATSVNSSGYVSVDSEYNNYGYSVALSLYGDFLAIGAPGTDLDEVSSSNSDHNGSNFTNSQNSTGNIKFGPHVGIGDEDPDMEVVGQLGFVQVYKGGLTNTQSWWTSNALVGQTMYGDAGVHEVNFDLTGSGQNWYGTSRWWKEPWSMPRMGFTVDISDDGTRVVAGSPSFSMKGYQSETWTGKIELFDFSSSLNAWVKSLSPLFGATMRGSTGHSFKLNSSNNRIVTQDLNSGGFSIMDYSGSSWYQNGNKNSWMSGTPTYGSTVLTACTITNGAVIVSANPGQNNGQVQFYNYLLTNTLAGNTLIGGYMAADEIFLGPSDNSLTNAYDKKISFGGTYADNNASLCTIERRVHNSSDLTGASELHIRHQGETMSDHIRLNAPELIFQVGGSDSVTAHMHINKEGNIGIGTDLYASTFISSVGDHWLSRSACTAGVDIDKDVQIRNKLNVNYAGRTALAGASGHTISRADTRDNEFVLSNWASSSQNVSYSSGFRAYEFTGGNSYVQGPSGSNHGAGCRIGLWLYLKDDHSTYTANNSKGQVLCAFGTVPTPAPTTNNRYQGCSLYLFYNSASDRGLRFWLGESNRYYVHQMDFVKHRWYCIDVKFPGQYSGNTTTTLQPQFYTSNAPNNIEDKKNHMLLLVDSVGKNLSVSGSGSASVAQGCISNPSGSWFGGNDTDSGNDGYGIHDVYMGLMYYIGGSGHQSAQPSVLFANGSPPEILSVGGDILTNGRIGVGTVQPNAACHVIGDINVEGEFRQNNSTLIGIGSSSSAGAPLQVLASTSNTSPTNNGILISQAGTSGTNHAIMAMKVNGANSGDPFVSWDTDVTGWSMGIDNNDDDKLKIANSKDALNTDTHMEFSSSGTDFKKTILANGSSGTQGQVLTSGGSGGTVSWTTVSGGGSSAWTTSGSDVYRSSGNVGIGTTSPGQKLQVDNGNILMTGTWSTGSTFALMGYNNSKQIQFSYNDGTWISDNNSIRFGVGGSQSSGLYSERMRITSAGKVGIGTTSPAYTLDVNGDINIAGGSSLRIGGVAQSFGGGSSAWTTSGSDVYRSSGKVGIGTSSPSRYLDVAGTLNATNGGLLVRNGDDNTASANAPQITFGWNGNDEYRHFIRTRHNSSAADNSIDFYVCDSTQNNSLTSGVTHNLTLESGKVGMNGVTDPEAPLHINASSTGTGPSSNGIYVRQSDSNKNAVMGVRVNGSGSGNPYVSWDIEGVAGWSAGIDNSNGDSWDLCENWDLNSSSGNVVAQAVRGSGRTKFRVYEQGGNVTADSNWPSWGGGFATWDILCTSMSYSGLSQRSDRNLKDNIVDIPVGLSQILQLRPVRYTWKDVPNGGPHYGLIAQEAESIIPELVRNDGDNNTYRIKQEIVPILIKATQELNTKVTTLETDNASLKTQVATLETQVADLISRVTALENA